MTPRGLSAPQLPHVRFTPSAVLPPWFSLTAMGRFTPNTGFYTLLSQTPALFLSCLWRMTILPLVPQAKMYEVIFDSSFLPGSQAILSAHSVSPLKCIQLPTFLLLPSSRPPLVTSGTNVKWAWWPVFLFSLNFVWLSLPDWLNRFSQISLSSL